MKTVALFGAGQIGAMVSRLLGTGYGACCFADNSEEKWGGELAGIPIVSPRDALLFDPEAVCIKSRAGYKDQIQRFRQQNLRPAQDGGADAVLSHLPAVRAGHSGCKGIRLAAHRIGQRFALRLRLFRKGRKVDFGPKR